MRIVETTVNNQRVLPAFHNWQSHLLIRCEPAFDSARIEQHSEPAVGRVPQFLIDFDEGARDRLLILVE